MYSNRKTWTLNLILAIAFLVMPATGLFGEIHSYKHGNELAAHHYYHYYYNNYDPNFYGYGPSYGYPYYHYPYTYYNSYNGNYNYDYYNPSFYYYPNNGYYLQFRIH